MSRQPPRKRPDNALTRYRRLHLLTSLLQAQRREVTAVADLQQQMKSAGLDVERRTLERDLRFLERALDDRVIGHPGFGWSWRHDLQEPVHTGPQHGSLWLTLAMIEHHLDLILPTDVLADLQPLFDQARTRLTQPLARTYQRWRDRVARTPGLQMLRPPELPVQTYTAIQQALLEQRVLTFNYQGEPSYRAVPLALVLDDGALYMVAHRLDQDPDAHNPRVYAVHRMRDCQATSESAPELPPFQLNRYLEDAASFQFPVLPGAPPIALDLWIHPDAARLFRERQIADDQQIETQPDGSLRLRARVIDSLRLQWFLLSYGDAIEVRSPPALRERIAGLLKSALRPYRRRSEPPN